MKKPNHPPFNDWLLSGEMLTPDQNRLLQEHLRNCPDCSQTNLAITEVKFLFQSSSQVNPAEGFANRWKIRLDHEHEKLKRRNAWVLFGVAGGMAFVILSLVIWRIYGLLDSPVILLSSLVYLWTLSQVFIRNMGEFFHLSLRFIPSISIIGFIFFMGFCSFISVLWLVAYRKLTADRRSTTW